MGFTYEMIKVYFIKREPLVKSLINCHNDTQYHYGQHITILKKLIDVQIINDLCSSCPLNISLQNKWQNHILINPNFIKVCPVL